MKELPIIPDPPKVGSIRKKVNRKPIAPRKPSELKIRLVNLEKLYSTEFKQLKDSFESHKKSQVSSNFIKELKEDIIQIKKDAKVDVDSKLEVKTKDILRKIEDIENKLKNQAPAPPIKPIETELHIVKKELIEELRVLKKDEIPKELARVEAKLDSFQKEVLGKLARVEAEAKEKIEESIKKAERDVKDFKEKLINTHSKFNTHKEYYDQSLEKLEQRFAEELSKVIEWINYFNSKL